MQRTLQLDKVIRECDDHLDACTRQIKKQNTVYRHHRLYLLEKKTKKINWTKLHFNFHTKVIFILLVFLQIFEFSRRK